MLDVSSIRRDFPLLERSVHGKPLLYLDNAATTQRPRLVIEAIEEFYYQHNANVHRGVHTVSEEATDRFEAARGKVARWINAKAEQCVFTRGTTEAINLVAFSFAEPMLKPGDEIMVSHMEHHSNIVPWQLVADRTGAHIRVIPVNDEGTLDINYIKTHLNERVKLVAVGYISNVLGTINPIEEITKLAHANGSYVVVDGAQALAHTPIDVEALGVDFLALSGHKAFGPTGIGILYGRTEHLEIMRPYQGGGEMIRWVSFDGNEYNEPPYKFEAGTPNIAGAIGFGAAIDYLTSLDMNEVASHEARLWYSIETKFNDRPAIRPIGTAEGKIAIFTFVIEGAHANDLGLLLDAEGIAVRTGHHCAMPLLERFGVTATVRASFSIYNSLDDVERFFGALDKVCKVILK